MEQQTFLREAMAELGLTREGFSARLGCSRRAMDKWLLPQDSSDFRRMDEATWNLVAQVLIHDRLLRVAGLTDAYNAALHIPNGDIKYLKSGNLAPASRGNPMTFPFTNEAADAATSVLIRAAAQIQKLYPDDTPEQISVGVQRAATEINNDARLELSVEAVVSRYPRVRPAAVARMLIDTYRTSKSTYGLVVPTGVDPLSLAGSAGAAVAKLAPLQVSAKAVALDAAFKGALLEHLKKQIDQEGAGLVKTEVHFQEIG